MNKINYYAIQSKLKLHKIDCEIDEAAGTITIGKGRANTTKTIGAVVLTLMGVALLIVVLAGLENPSRLGIYVSVGFIALGLILLSYELRKWNQNMGKKTISSKGIEVVEIGNQYHIESKRIVGLNVKTELLREAAKGSIIIQINDGGEKALLHLIDNDMKHIRADVEFLSEQFLMLLKSENVE